MCALENWSPDSRLSALSMMPCLELGEAPGGGTSRTQAGMGLMVSTAMLPKVELESQTVTAGRGL